MKNEPTLDQWRRLYQIAMQFKELACWDWMYDDDVFGVEDPETGEIAFCTIMGNAGQHYAIAGYLGKEGLNCIKQMQEGPDPEIDADLGFSQKCLMCSFEDREFTKPQDRKLIKELALTFRGRDAWPVFRDFQPGLEPWYLTDVQCQFLTLIIEQAMDVANWCRTDKSLISSETEDRYLIRRSKKSRNGELTWYNEYQEIESSPSYVSFVLSDEIKVNQLSKLSKSRSLILEVDTFFLPNLINDGERPYFAKACMIVDGKKGQILGIEMIRNTNTEGYKLLEYIEKIITSKQKRPAVVYVSKLETFYLISDFCKQLGIELDLRKHLPYLRNAKRGLMESMSRR